MRRELDRADGWRQRWLPRRVQALPELACSPWHTPDLPLAAAGRPEPCGGGGSSPVRRVMVLRHPYERAVSQFYWRAGGAWATLLGYGASEMNRFVREAVANASRAEETLGCKTCRVYDMVRGGPYHQDCHWLPQVAYAATWGEFGARARPPLRFCYGDHVEALANYSDGVAVARGGVDATLGDLVDAGACAPADDCRKWASLEDATIAALNAHYAADFARFGFQRVAAARDLVVRTNGARRSLAAPGRGCDDIR